MRQIFKRFGAGMLAVILLFGVVFGPGSSTTVEAAKRIRQNRMLFYI